MPMQINSSFDYFESLFKNSKQNTVVMMDEKGIITHINAAFTNGFGYTEKDIIGKHTSILFTEEDQSKKVAEIELGRVLATGQSADNNYLVHKNKTITWVSGESILVKNKNNEVNILKIIQDIHQQKTTENALRDLNAFNESILASIEDAVIVLNSELKIVKCNKAFHKIFAIDACTEMADFAKLIKPFDINDDLKNKLKNTFNNTTGFLNKAIEIKTSTAEKRVYDISCRLMEDNSKVLLVAHDITVQRYSERQREDIIGFVAHELRNPLANIILCNTLMEETIKENNSEEIADLLLRSKNNVLRLNKMIADLYDATKVGSGNMQLETAEFNFEQMIKEAVATIETLQPDYKINILGHANIMVHGDRHRLIQVVTNYLSNGIKYSKGSSKVELTIKHDKKEVTVSVKDKGLGISKEQLPYVFDRFFRAEKTKNLEGVGLGLYLCRQIIKAHNGNVWVESEEEKGSTFYFSIPL